MSFWLSMLNTSRLHIGFYSGRFRQMTDTRRCRGTLCPLNADSSSFRISWVKLYLASSLDRCRENKTKHVTVCSQLHIVQSRTQLLHTSLILWSSQSFYQQMIIDTVQTFLCIFKLNLNTVYYLSNTIYIQPQYVERASGQQELQPLVAAVHFHQAHDAAGQKVQSRNSAATELKTETGRMKGQCSWFHSTSHTKCILEVTWKWCTRAHARISSSNPP